MKNVVVLLFSCMLVFGVGVCSGGSLRKNFYKKTCPKAEETVRNFIWGQLSNGNNSALPAKLLRMHFHDCFVRGCDASILLNSTSNSTAEKDAGPNQSLTGFDILDRLKALIESQCLNTVSCADILALAARDAVSFQYKQSLWEVLTGRRDGNVSLASEVGPNIPSPASNLTVLRQNFANKKLTEKDLVVLSGAHTIGVAHCGTFNRRLYNFTRKGDADPQLNPMYADFLRTKCKSLTDTNTPVEMDPGSSSFFSSHYYLILQQHMGLFQSDAALLTDEDSGRIANELMDKETFFEEFQSSIMKMGAIGVLNENEGEIRKICSMANS
ncbi:peroxidase 24 [Amborella trichopoda]|uniref:peroxidase 24 n=1 Tax=Amborella trichopoda TaxID=13333 RepID=UPI0009C100E0|nr:peroxidase 24 [Amborella trichopoda]|eukprot:XP_020529831.1 peroxidase 24 [Amborella trichopoda]